jgi:Ca2+-binding EF-hand superfamily protein
MLKEQHAVDMTAKNLQKEREDERIMNQLRAEFARIDISQDGSVTLDELRQLLLQNTEGQVDTGIAEAIFQEIDIDGSGAVLLQEFVESYFIKQKIVKERLSEVEETLRNHKKSREQL